MNLRDAIAAVQLCGVLHGIGIRSRLLVVWHVFCSYARTGLSNCSILYSVKNCKRETLEFTWQPEKAGLC